MGIKEKLVNIAATQIKKRISRAPSKKVSNAINNAVQDLDSNNGEINWNPEQDELTNLEIFGWDTGLDVTKTGGGILGENVSELNPESIDPYDCEAWPNSPFCGGGFDPIKAIGFNVDFVEKDCLICAVLSPVFAGIQMPPYYVCARKPNCDDPEPEEYPPEDSSEEQNEEIDFPLGGDANDEIALVQCQISFKSRFRRVYRDHPDRNSYLNIDRKAYYSFFDPYLRIGQFNWEENKEGNDWLVEDNGINKYAIEYKYSQRDIIKNSYWNYDGESGSSYESHNTFEVYTGNAGIPTSYQGHIEVTTISGKEVSLLFPHSEIKIYWGKRHKLAQAFPKLVTSEVYSETSSKHDNYYGDFIYTANSIQKYKYKVFVAKPKKTIDTGILDDMSCCEDMKALMRMIRQMHQVIAPNEFADDCSVPTRWLYPGESGQTPINNYAQLLEALMRQIDRAVGYWPLTLDIKDADPNKEGDQPAVMSIQSISDALKETLAINFEMSKEILLMHSEVKASRGTGLESIKDPALREIVKEADEATNDANMMRLLVSIFYQVMQSHILLANTYQVADNIEEDLGYKARGKQIEIPLAGNPNAHHRGFGIPKTVSKDSRFNQKYIDNLLDPQLWKVRISEHDDKQRTRDMLLNILRDTRNIAAVHTEQIDSADGLRKLIDGAGLIAEVARYLDRDNIRKAMGTQIGDLDDALRAAETAYGELDGNTPTLEPTAAQEPYNRPRDERPKARRSTKPKRKK